MKRWLFLLAITCVWGCTDDETTPATTSSTTTTSTTSTTSSSSSGTGGSGGESSSSTTSSGTGGAGGGGNTVLEACVDKYDALPMAPDGKLPCELIPPGLKLEQSP